MNRPSLLIALTAALLPGLALADDTVVYKSKNADGTTVYSQIETRDSEARTVDGRDPAVADQPKPEAQPPSSMEIACTKASANLDLFNSGKRLQRDKNGDGVNEDLTAEEIASEKDLAQRQVTAFCTPKPES